MPSAKQALQSVLEAGAWIARTPLALFVIVGGLLIDSVIRLFLTFGSTYYRLIGLPEASYGLIGAGLAGLGMLVSPLARRLVASGSVLRLRGLPLPERGRRFAPARDGSLLQGPGLQPGLRLRQPAVRAGPARLP